MQRIFKYPLKVDDEQTIETQPGSILSVQVQNGTPCLWMLIDDGSPSQKLRVRIAGTGHPCPDVSRSQYIGTFQLRGGGLVFHTFAEWIA